MEIEEVDSPYVFEDQLSIFLEKGAELMVDIYE